MEEGESSPTVAIQSNLCGLMIISSNFTCRDFNTKLKFYAVKLKFRAKIKLYSWQNFLVCRDIKFLVATFSTLGGTIHPLVVKANISSMCYDVTTTYFQRDSFLSRPLLFFLSY